MRAFLLVITIVFIFSSCKKQQESPSCAKPKTGKKKFEMYTMSEMSLLMEQMYADHERLKEKIKKGEDVGTFPDYFLKIHKASMTDSTENDKFFQEQASVFIAAQRRIYSDPKNADKHFNAGVDACLKCHEVKCGGPIPRIKKLYIN